MRLGRAVGDFDSPCYNKLRWTILKGSNRVLRGGSWNYDAAYCRSAFRSADAPTSRDSDFGFRLALSPSGVKSPEAEQDKGAEP